MGKPRPVGGQPVRPVGRPVVYTEPRHHLGVRIPMPLFRRVRGAAAARHRTITEYVIELLDRHTPR